MCCCCRAELAQGIAHAAALFKIRLHFRVRVAAGGIVPLFAFPQQIIPVRILAEAAVTVIVQILDTAFIGRFIPPGNAEMSIPNEKQVGVHQRDQLIPCDRLAGGKLRADRVLRLLEVLLTEIIVSAVGVMQRAEVKVHILERFRAGERRLTGVIQVHQTVDLCLCDLDLAAVVLKIVLKPVKGHFACHIGAAFFVHVFEQLYKRVLIDCCGTLAQNYSGIAVGIIIDGKAERIAEVAQLKIVVSADVVDGKTVHSLSVDQNGLLADNSCFGMILPARKLAADGDIFFSGNDRDRVALFIERNGKAAVRLAQKLRKIAQLEIVAAVDVVFVTVCIDAVD